MSNMELELLVGLPISVDDNLQIYQYKVIEIIKDIGMDEYDKNLSLLLIDRDYVEEVLDDYDTKFSPLEFVLANSLHNEEFRILIVNAYEMFLKCEVVFDVKYGIIFVQDDTPYMLDEELFKKIQKTLRKIHSIPEPKEYKPANEKAGEFIKKLKRNRRNARKYQKSDFTLADIISGIKWKSGDSYESIFNLTMFQVYDGLSRLQIIDNYENNMLGIYTGKIDAEKAGIKVDWFKSMDKKDS